MMTKLVKTIVFSVLFLGFSSNINAQFWKKLKNKVQEKISKTEDKIIKKLDKKSDKIIDSSFEKKSKTKNSKDFKSFGNAKIIHSEKYGNVIIPKLYQAKVNKQGTTYKIIGNWQTTGIDVFDGFYLEIKNGGSLENLKNKRTFSIPNQAVFRMGYEPIAKGSYEGESSGFGQEIEFIEGTVSIKFAKDEELSLQFNGKVNLTVDFNTDKYGDYTAIKKLSTISGNIASKNPLFSLTKASKEKNSNSAQEIITNISPTINIPSSFSFDKSIEVEVIDDRGEKYPIKFLTGKYPDIYGLSVSPKEMQQGEVTMVMTPKSSTMFMNIGGMKIKKSSSIEQMGDQYNMTEKLPKGSDFAYVKTGKTKIIMGYNCDEYKVVYNYTNEKGSASFWVSKEFPIQNKDLPMLGMKMNNPYFSGFVLELNSSHQGQNTSMKVISVSNESLTINTSEYKKMGF